MQIGIITISTNTSSTVALLRAAAVAIVLFRFMTGASTQDSAAAASPSLTANIIDDVRASLHDAYATSSGPSQWGGRQWTITAVSVGAAGAAFALDEDVRSFAQSHLSTAGNRLILPWQDLGNGLYAAGFSGAMYGSGLLLGNGWLRETGRCAATSLALTGLVTTVLKVTVGRSRPFVGKGPRQFAFFQTDDDDWSFPSGHAATAFALVSALAERIDNVYVTAPLYCAAAMTGVARVYGDQHWCSDALVGAMIGTAIGDFVGRRSRIAYHAGAVRIELEPIAAGDAAGIGVAVSY